MSLSREIGLGFAGSRRVGGNQHPKEYASSQLYVGDVVPGNANRACGTATWAATTAAVNARKSAGEDAGNGL